MADIGGRSLRVVAAGPADAQPLILLVHGAFGCAADWGVVQSRLSAKGYRTLAYDRAGMGLSEPGPRPRDARAAAEDLDRLLDRLGERGPLVLVGHSMGGLYVRHYALSRPRCALGVVMVDAMTPEIIGLRGGAHAIGSFGALLRVASVAARVGLMHPVSAITHDLIGLEGEAKGEKRRIHRSAGHAHWSAEEVAHWAATSAAAGEAAFPPDLPLAVITAGGERNKPWLKRLQAAPALAAQHGYVEHVAGSTHANVLGRRFAHPVVRGVEHVLRASATAARG